MSSKQSVTRADLETYAQFFNQLPMVQSFGVVLSFPDEQTVLLTLAEIRADQRGGLGADAVNGGVLAALFDLAIGFTPALVNPHKRTATIELAMHFMRAVRGPSLTVRAKIDRASETLCFSSASVFDAQGTECAGCHGISRISNVSWSADAVPSV